MKKIYLEDAIKYDVRTEYVLIMDWEFPDDSMGVFFEGSLKDLRRQYLDGKVDLSNLILRLDLEEQMYKGRETTVIYVTKERV